VAIPPNNSARANEAAAFACRVRAVEPPQFQHDHQEGNRVWPHDHVRYLIAADLDPVRRFEDRFGNVAAQPLTSVRSIRSITFR
jgi:hypothetical protein